ncbi:hypothetical protein D3C80_1605700 [compost metagenome]
MIDSAQRLRWRGSLALLPALVGLEGHHAERSQRRVVHAAATTLAAHAATHASATEHAAEDASQAAAHSSSTAHAAGGTAATAAEQTSQQVAETAHPAAHAALFGSVATAALLHRAHAGLQQVLKQIAAVHGIALAVSTVPVRQR